MPPELVPTVFAMERPRLRLSGAFIPMIFDELADGKVTPTEGTSGLPMLPVQSFSDWGVSVGGVVCGKSIVVVSIGLTCGR